MTLFRWTLVETDPGPAAQTMAVDEAILRRAVRHWQEGPVLRVYGWAAPALSVGVHTEVREGVLDRCRAAGVEVVRRPTGGGAVLHDGDVTYAVVARHEGRGVLEIYRWVAGGLIAGLRRLGLDARIVEHGRATRALACFAEPTGADLEVGGRKVCGSAQVRRGDWFLQHGSIPLPDVRARTAALLGVEAGTSTCLDRLCPGIAWRDARDALVAGFTDLWGGPPAVRRLDPCATL